MMKTLLIVLLGLMLVVSYGEARTVNIEASVACRPELLPFLPGRVREICSGLRQTQPNYYFNSGKLEISKLYLLHCQFLIKSSEMKEETSTVQSICFSDLVDHPRNCRRG